MKRLVAVFCLVFVALIGLLSLNIATKRVVAVGNCSNFTPLFETDSLNPKRIRLWGGVANLASGTCASPTQPGGFPSGLVCYDNFQIGTVGRGLTASLLVVQPPSMSTGIAIRDDVAFQTPTLCMSGFPAISLNNNWTSAQTITFHLEGTIQ